MTFIPPTWADVGTFIAEKWWLILLIIAFIVYVYKTS